MKDPYSVPKAMRETCDTIGAMTSDFCRAKLTEEYAQICRKMIAQLGRKRPSPLTRGRPQNWAAGVIHVVATVNFAFDRTQDPHITAPEISDFFGVGQSSASAKSRVIRDLLDIYQMDPEWTLPSLIDRNPMVWYIVVNGFIVDARYAPLPIQIEAYERGLIPYVPDLQEKDA